MTTDRAQPAGTVSKRMGQSSGALITLIVTLAVSSIAVSQTNQELENTASQSFDGHDLTGIWVVGGTGGTDERFDVNRPPEESIPEGVVYRGAYHNWVISTDRPPMTSWGQEKFDAVKTSYGDPWTGRPPAPIEEWNDPSDQCGPVGYPRAMLEWPASGVMKFVQTPTVLVQLFEWHRNWRDIWLDGRGLHEDPEPRYYGYAVGRWDEDTLVVESNGFNDRAWLDIYGHPRSGEMRLTERFRRISHNELEWHITLIDPKTYKWPWTGKKILTLHDKSPRSGYEELREDICVWADLQEFWRNMDTFGVGDSLTRSPEAR